MRDEAALPEGNQWRYSEFISAVQGGKVERVRFSKDGTMLQLTAIDGRRATVVLPNDPDLVDILARNGVDISVSEGDQQGNYVALLGNILFPLIAFGGLFFLFRRAQGGSGGSGSLLAEDVHGKVLSADTTALCTSSWGSNTYRQTDCTVSRTTHGIGTQTVQPLDSATQTVSYARRECQQLLCHRSRTVAAIVWWTVSERNNSQKQQQPTKAATLQLPYFCGKTAGSPYFRCFCMRGSACAALFAPSGSNWRYRQVTASSLAQQLSCGAHAVLLLVVLLCQPTGGGGPMGPMGGPMEFGRSKSKFQEVPETGVTFADVAVSCCWALLPSQSQRSFCDRCCH